jgi:hypothetical protein
VNERLVTFLYTLMRDTVPCGVVERIMSEHVENRDHTGGTYSNKHLEAYAREIIDRINDTSDFLRPPTMPGQSK